MHTSSFSDLLHLVWWCPVWLPGGDWSLCSAPEHDRCRHFHRRTTSHRALLHPSGSATGFLSFRISDTSSHWPQRNKSVFTIVLFFKLCGFLFRIYILPGNRLDKQGKLQDKVSSHLLTWLLSIWEISKSWQLQDNCNFLMDHTYVYSNESPFLCCKRFTNFNSCIKKENFDIYLNILWVEGKGFKKNLKRNKNQKKPGKNS